ncbi:methyltransferase domain-containing protein [Epilithonimonas vandammei]|uniref:carnosine N-methyltransferase n=2 Tax=Epilithonimonas vandammei TaxID=2487072 RepID=A0A3G8ZEI4_9FLAO|nr:methyltransferase domain-containing protein [Epilithonimonas vandammei]
MINSTIYTCPICGSNQLEIVKEEIICPQCESHYPKINDIPIFVENTFSYINDTYISLECHIKNIREYIESNQKMFPFQNGRISTLNKIVDSYTQNLVLYEQMSESIKKYVNINYILQSDLNRYKNDPLIGKELLYVVRDWGYSNESEDEISSIYSMIEKLIKKFSILDSILFIGCGTGRFACEASQIVKKVYCSDLSYRMIYLLDGILNNKSFNIHEINDSNVYSIDDVIRNFTVKASNLSSTVKNINYFISDVRQLPIEDESLNTVASVYFIDVMNIENYIQEISRVLKTNGVFINIGPIGYPYSNFVHKILPTEIKQIFKKNNFEIVFEEFLECTYMHSNIKLSKTIHKNWIFVARKKTENQVSINIDSVLSINTSVFIETKVEINNHGSSVFEHNLITKNGSVYEHSDLIIEILKQINGKISIKQIIEVLSENFELEFEADYLLSVIGKLIKDKTLELVQ